MHVGVRDSGAREGHPRRWAILAVVCLSVLIALMDVTIVNVALPTLSTELDASTSQLQWVVDAYTLVFAGLLLMFGYLADRLGRRRVLQWGLALFAVTGLIAAFAPTIGALIASRGAMGIAAAMIYPATLAIITTTFVDVRERAMAVGIWAGTTGVAVALGPVIGGLLLEHFAWGSVFLINIPLAALAMALNVVVVPESRDPRPGRLDVPGVIGSVAAIGMLVWAIIEAPHRGWLSPTTLADLTAAAVLIGAFVLWEATRPEPLLDVKLFANARFSAAAAAISLAFFGLFGFIFMVTQYFQAVQSWSPFQAGLRTLPFAIVTALMSPVAILLMRWVGTTKVVVVGLWLMAAGFGLAATADADSPYWGVIVTSMCLMAAGLAFVSGPATEAIMGALPEAKVGAGSAVNDTTREVGGTLGVAIVGSVMASVYAPNVADRLADRGVPAPLREQASESVIGALQIAAASGEEAGPLATAVRLAFMDGFRAGALVSGFVCLLGAIAALRFLPAHAKPTSVLFGVADTPTPPEDKHPTPSPTPPVDDRRPVYF
ncbi:MAG: DHA2 family efflux MFS transporter permease subunit [Sporichthyaceae bacterium]